MLTYWAFPNTNIDISLQFVQVQTCALGHEVPELCNQGLTTQDTA